MVIGFNYLAYVKLNILDVQNNIWLAYNIQYSWSKTLWFSQVLFFFFFFQVL